MTIYNSWRAMKERCYNKNCKGYKNYGGRGITVCDDWQKFKNFESWALQNGYENGLSIDRINNDGIYEPSNCRWTSNKVQANNKTTSTKITIGNETKTIAEWAEETGLKYNTICARNHYYNWDKENLLKPKREYKLYEYNGEKKTIHAWAKALNIPLVTLWHRISKQNKTFEEAITM